MSIRTLEDLSDTLDSELAWRKKELAALKSLAENRSFSGNKSDAILRSGITILYAHWEGFIKVASESYLEFVATRRLPYNRLSYNFIALAMKNKLARAAEANKTSIHTEIVEFLLSRLDERSSLPYRNAIKTAANLSSSVLQEIVNILGLDYSPFQTKEKLIDQQLLAQRNTIAHGQYLLPQRDDYSKLHEQVIQMMENFRNQIYDNAVLKKYEIDQI